MGKKRSRQKKPPVPPTTAGQVVDSNTPEPMGNVETDRAIASLWTRFWDRPFHPLQLLVFRFCFFALVAFESFRDLEHAPRYGAGGFNVPHFPILELLPTPSRYGMVVLYLAQCALSLRVAFGLGGRVTVWALTAVYGYTYFISQLDSYQHHYMVFLFLFLTCLVDWESDKPRTWPIQLVVVQTGIVYMWAGVTKLHPLWTEGTLLRRQAGGGEFGALVKSWCDSLGVSLDQAWWFMANWSMAAEFVVPLLFLSLPMIPEGRGRLRDGLLWLTCALGLGLHVGIEMAQLKIGLFSYMMMSFYLLVMPVLSLIHI